MKNFFLIGSLVCSAIFYSQTKNQKLKELIYSSGNFSLSEKNVNDLFAAYKKRYSDVPDSEWEFIRKKININDLIDEVSEIYGNKFSESEINELYAFYQSELGKKVFQNSLGIKNEIQDAIGTWASDITKIIDTYLEAKKFKKPEPVSSQPPPPMRPKK